jgi:farnesyl-diphosphate farnesyltransferase
VDGWNGLCLVIGMGFLLIPESSDRCGVTWELLPHVSRTFALTIPVLDGPLRDQVAVAYLLCRIADTIEDAEEIPGRMRRELFEMLLDLLGQERTPALETRFRKTWCGQVDAFHQELMERSDEVFDAYSRLPDPVQDAIAACLREMVPGMVAFLEHRPLQNGHHRPCRTIEELEAYCHVVAGTVGILLTRLFSGELGVAWATPMRYEEGRRFGLGLQITNVLKDADRDHCRGVSYLPDDPAALIPIAVSHLDQALRYALSIPRSRPDLRLFCVWACHLALATLARIARGEPGKVPRPELARLLEGSRDSIADDAALETRHRELRDCVIVR